MPVESVIPQSAKRISGSALKVIAVVTMIIDHTGAYLPRIMAGIVFRCGWFSLRLYDVLRFVGRISFPLFCFLLVEGFLHTRDRKQYALRLFLFALLSEPLWNLVHSGRLLYPSQNVFFTLLFGFLGLCLLERLALAPESRRSSAALLVLLLLVSLVFRADYGSSGFGFILLLYLLRTRPLSRAVVGSCFLSSGWKAGLAFVPIAFYNGKRGFLKGRAASLCFYAIYPLQMLIFYIIRKNTVGF